MKKFILLSFLLISTENLLTQNGWFWQNPLPQGNDLNAVEILPNGIVYTGGFSGTILKSTDNCQTWILKSNVNQYTGWFHDISFQDNNNGWTVGQDWGLFYTDNNGLTWNQKYLNTYNIIYDIYFKTKDTAWACGTGSNIIKTTNNWQNWVIQYSNLNQSYHFKSIAFIDMNSGICVGSTNSGANFGVMYVTSNSGNSWQQVNTPITASLESIVCFPNGVVVIVSGDGSVLRSTDRGVNWNDNIISPGNLLNEVNFINDNTGWTAGNSGKIFKTTDNGITWNLLNSGTVKNLKSIKFNTPNTGYAVGQDGIIIHTSNGGADWTQETKYINNNNFTNIRGIKFLNANTGFVFGAYGLAAKTTNGGINWDTLITNTNKNFNCASFLDVNNIWICGDNGLILKTSNLGLNWITITPPSNNNISGIQFVDQSNGYLLNNSAKKFYKTTNGGLNWITSVGRPQNLGNNALYFINSQTGFVSSGGGYIHKTVNGGLTWNEFRHSSNLNFNSFSFVNDNTGWACGDLGVIVKTTDSGNSWFQQNNSGQYFRKIMFINENTGWAVGYYGFMKKTVNGGQSWQAILTGTYDWLEDVNFIDTNTGWIAGGNSILKTTNGGIPLPVSQISSQLPQSFLLQQNYPNPFNPVTKIKFDLPKQSNTRLIICDLLGREITTLVNEQLDPGTYSVDWDGSAYASGVYLYSLITEGFTETKRMVLIK